MSDGISLYYNTNAMVNFMINFVYSAVFVINLYSILTLSQSIL